jgi:hypothetical protein
MLGTANMAPQRLNTSFEAFCSGFRVTNDNF